MPVNIAPIVATNSFYDIASLVLLLLAPSSYLSPLSNPMPPAALSRFSNGTNISRFAHTVLGGAVAASTVSNFIAQRFGKGEAQNKNPV